MLHPPPPHTRPLMQRPLPAPLCWWPPSFSKMQNLPVASCSCTKLATLHSSARRLSPLQELTHSLEGNRNAQAPGKPSPSTQGSAKGLASGEAHFKGLGAESRGSSHLRRQLCSQLRCSSAGAARSFCRKSRPVQEETATGLIIIPASRHLKDPPSVRYAAKFVDIC